MGKSITSKESGIGRPGKGTGSISAGDLPATPMMKQYLEIKERCPDSILFFRLGDFYEMFFDDARLVSRELELVLTGKDCGMAERAPMCGIPYHASLSYISRLIAKGYKVSVCEQIEDPALAKGLVKRDIIKVYTPGTVTDESMLDQKSNNYIMCVYEFKGMYGIAAADLSTGEMYVTSLTVGSTYNRLCDEIARLAPSEFIVNADSTVADKLGNYLKEISHAFIGTMPKDNFDPAAGFERFTAEIAALKPAARPPQSQLRLHELGITAYGALMNYLESTQKVNLDRIMTPELYTVAEYMAVDASSRRNLEITETMRDKSKRGSLLWVLDRTQTAMGGRALKHWIEQPLIDADAINRRLDAVEELKDAFMMRQTLIELLGGIYDIERLVGKVSLGTASPKDLASLRLSLEKLPALKETLAYARSELIKQCDSEIDPLEETKALLERAIVPDPPMLMKDGGFIKAGYSEEVDTLREASVSGKDWLSALEAKEKERTGIKTLKVGYNKVFGYYIEVSNSFKDLVPETYIRKQTLTGGERFITEELKQMEDTILGAQERVIRLENRLFGEIRVKVAEKVSELTDTARALAALDALSSLSEVADRENYCRPEITDSSEGEIILKDSRHPVVEKMLPAGDFIPNDVNIDLKESRMLVITGPNMAGKSTYMRQTALCVLMCQAGSFVPASYARISVVDKLFTRVGASDDLASGRSTFMVEMSEVANILQGATGRSFLILDEIGRGTGTFDGLSIAWAVLEYIHNNIGARTMFATHYHELTELENRMSGVRNYCSDAERNGDSIVFKRKIRPGAADGSYGVCVAALAGIPKAVTLRAQELSDILESESETVGRRGAGQDRQSGRSGRRGNSRRQQDIYDGGSPDLIAYATSTVMQDEIIETLRNMKIQEMTPIEAMNELYKLWQKAAGRG